MKHSVKFAAEEIATTLKAADNEGTAAPFWMVIDPGPMLGIVSPFTDEEDKTHDFEYNEHDTPERISKLIPHCFEGPFFSREDAEGYLKSRHYEYSDRAYVWCASGYWSQKYKAFCREVGVGV